MSNYIQNISRWLNGYNHGTWPIQGSIPINCVTILTPPGNRFISRVLAWFSPIDWLSQSFTVQAEWKLFNFHYFYANSYISIRMLYWIIMPWIEHIIFLTFLQTPPLNAIHWFLWRKRSKYFNHIKIPLKVVELKGFTVRRSKIFLRQCYSNNFLLI